MCAVCVALGSTFTTSTSMSLPRTACPSKPSGVRWRRKLIHTVLGTFTCTLLVYHQLPTQTLCWIQNHISTLSGLRGRMFLDFLRYVLAIIVPCETIFSNIHKYQYASKSHIKWIQPCLSCDFTTHKHLILSIPKPKP